MFFISQVSNSFSIENLSTCCSQNHYSSFFSFQDFTSYAFTKLLSTKYEQTL